MKVILILISLYQTQAKCSASPFFYWVSALTWFMVLEPPDLMQSSCYSKYVFVEKRQLKMNR